MINLEAGQVWLTAGGETAVVLGPHLSGLNCHVAVYLAQAEEPLRSDGRAWAYLPDGRALGFGPDSSYGLRTLIYDPKNGGQVAASPRRPEPVKADPSSRPPLAIGQRWRNRDGDEAVVEQEDLTRLLDSDSRFRVRHSSEAVIWHGVDGKPNINSKDFELIELLSDTTARQFKQIAATGDRLFALADDGTAWALHHSLPVAGWVQLPSLPESNND